MALWDFLPWVGKERGWTEEHLNPLGLGSLSNPVTAPYGITGFFANLFGDDDKPKPKSSASSKPVGPLGGTGGSVNDPYGYGSDSYDLGQFSTPRVPAAVLASSPGINKEYLSMLQGATQAQLAPIEALYAAGLSELTRRNQEAKGLLKLLPGQVKGVGADQRGAALDLADTFGGMVKGMAPVSLASVGMQPTLGLEPALGAMEAITQSRLQDVPYLGVANRQFYGGQMTALDAARQEQVAAVRRQEADALTQLALQQMQDQGAIGRFNAEQQNLTAREQAQLEAETNRARASYLGSLAEGELPPEMQSFGTFEINPDRGRMLGQTGADIPNDTDKTWAYAQGLVTNAFARDEKGVYLNEEPIAALQVALAGWVAEAPNDAARQTRAMVASVLLSRYGG